MTQMNAMCGRFTLHHRPEQIAERFGVELALPGLELRYNIAPTQNIVAVTEEDGVRTMQLFSWGLVPSWAKDPKIGNKMINARAETITEKPSYRTAFARRRCLIPADGFYEWRRTGSTKTPMHIRMSTGDLFGFAGIWEAWRAADGAILRSCSIITVAPNEVVAPIHDRMPAIISRENEQLWLDATYSRSDRLSELLAPFPASSMEAFAVGRSVNSPSFDDPTCMEPVETDE